MWSLIRQYKIYFIIGALMVLFGIVIAVAVFMQSSNNNSATPGTRTQQTESLSKKLNYPGSPQKEVTEEWIYYKVVNGSIKIRNIFPKDYDPTSLNPLVLAETAGYKIDYDPNGDIFEVWILDPQNNLQQTRSEAEQKLISLLGAPNKDICQLPIFLYESKPDLYRPNNYNVGLSFCSVN